MYKKNKNRETKCSSYYKSMCCINGKEFHYETMFEDVSNAYNKRGQLSKINIVL